MMERGHLAPDVTVENGRVVIADFGVNSRSIKASTKQEPLLRQWLNTFQSDPSYRLRILGYSDCVSMEKTSP